MKRLPMKNIREVLRLRSQGFSGRRVAHCLGAGVSTVQDYFKRADLAGVDGAQAQGLSERELERLLFPRDGEEKPGRFPVPDWKEVHRELRRKGVTRQRLWLEYRERHPDGYGYSRFCDRLRAWRGQTETTMPQEHRAGERLFVDYAGQTVAITCPDTDKVRHAQVFVATLGASSYTFAEVTWSQKLGDFLASHARAFAFFGGVPEQVVPDNLKAAVTAACRYDLCLNLSHGEMLDFFGTVGVPARPRKPKDKGKVEKAVQDIGRYVLAALRYRKFFSLEEANEAVRGLVDAFNAEHSRYFGTSRRKMFESIDRPALRPLPAQPWEDADMVRCRVPEEGYVPLGRARYSVPCRLVGCWVWLRVTARTVEILHGGGRVASHARIEEPAEGPPQYVTCRDHLPARYRYREEWAEDRLLARASAIGDGARRFVEAVLGAGRHPEKAARTCVGTLGLTGKFERGRVDAACGRAVEINGLSYRSVQSILKSGLDRAAPAKREESPPIVHRNVRGAAYFAGEARAC